MHEVSIPVFSGFVSGDRGGSGFKRMRLERGREWRRGFLLSFLRAFG